CFSTTEGVGWAALRAAASRVDMLTAYAAQLLCRSAQTHVRDLLRRSPWVRQGAFLLRRGWDSAPVRLRRILAALRSLRSLRVEPTFAIFFEDRRGFDRAPFYYGGGGIRTHVGLRPPVFKTGALNRSATPPSAIN